MGRVPPLAEVKGDPLWYQRHSLTSVLVTEQERERESPYVGVKGEVREMERTGRTAEEGVRWEE